MIDKVKLIAFKTAADSQDRGEEELLQVEGN
jgi:hypothetical protein